MSKKRISAAGFQISKNGRIRSVMGREHIQNCLRSGILTRRGERKDAPNLGSSISEILFRRPTPTLLREAGESLKLSLNEMENRIEIRRVSLLPNREQPGVIQVVVDYYYPHLESSEQFSLEVGARHV